jgi:hypothetical protein
MTSIQAIVACKYFLREMAQPFTQEDQLKGQSLLTEEQVGSSFFVRVVFDLSEGGLARCANVATGTIVITLLSEVSVVCHASISLP